MPILIGSALIAAAILLSTLITAVGTRFAGMESPNDENSLAAPHKVAPRTEELTLPGTRFARSFPGNSFTVLRIPVTK